ncbi:MAG: hypothetical protein E6K53_09890 [Gammaproteobacteria bacterium]|nr:MAG: hypothetical protein E6K53_09890 [Gammaproteobacteria bacterium]
MADFVRKGKGYRPIIQFGADWNKYEHHFGHFGKVEDQGWYCIFRLAHFNVLVDLRPDLTAFKKMAHQLYQTSGRSGREGWTTIPTDAVSENNGQLIVKADGN